MKTFRRMADHAPYGGISRFITWKEGEALKENRRWKAPELRDSPFRSGRGKG